MNKKLLLKIFFLALSVFLLWLALKGVDFIEITQAFENINWLYVSASTILVLFGLFVRSLRLKAMLDEFETVPSSRMYQYFMLGCFLNSTIPARIGEISRAHIIGKNEGVSRTKVLSTTLSERFFDLLGVVLLFFVSNFLIGHGLDQSGSFLKLSVLFFVIVVFLFLVAFQRHRMANLLLRVVRFFPAKIKNFIETKFEFFVQGFDYIKQKNKLLRIFAYTLVVWILACVPIYLVGVGLGLPFSFVYAAWVLAFISLSNILPLTPGNIGLMHISGTYAMVILGYGRADALAFSIIYHAIQFLPVIFVGFIIFLKFNKNEKIF